MKNLAEPEVLQQFHSKLRKNLVLWHGQSWFRKGLEVPTTALMEIFWPQRTHFRSVFEHCRILVMASFGVEAASRYYFKKSAKKFNSIRSGITRCSFTESDYL